MKKRVLPFLLALVMALALLPASLAAKTLVSIEVTTPPTKTEYTEGETFDPAGMVVTATYSDGTSAAVTGYKYTPIAPLSVDNQAVAISYVEGGVMKAVGYPIKVTHNSQEAPLPFTDVKKSDYFYDAVAWVYQNDIMSGYSATTFGPANTLTRAQVVQVMYNWAKKPAVTGDNPFKDVPDDQWYHDAVIWGAANNVVAGFGGGLFKPDDPVTIEQVCVILHNYSGKPKGNGSLDGVGQYSDWAEPALHWAAANGILKGLPFTNATEQANRAQTAYMMANHPQ